MSRVSPDAIKAFRRKHGFSQPELGEAIGCGRGVIANLEQGRQDVTIPMSDRLSCFFKFVDQCAANGRL